MHQKRARNHSLSETQRLVDLVISAFRGVVEMAFGNLKRVHRITQARCLRAAKVGLQQLLGHIAFNLKKHGGLCALGPTDATDQNQGPKNRLISKSTLRRVKKSKAKFVQSSHVAEKVDQIVVALTMGHSET